MYVCMFAWFLQVETDIWATFFAIVAHKGIETFALATTLTRSGVSTTMFNCLTGSFALVTPVAILIGTLLSASSLSSTGSTTDTTEGDGPVWIPFLVSFSSGMFVYIG